MKLAGTDTFKHEEYSCRKIPCRNAQHWKLRHNGKEVKDTSLRIDAMRSMWHNLTD